MGLIVLVCALTDATVQVGWHTASSTCTGFCRIFVTELEDRRPKTVPYLEEVVDLEQ